VPKRSKEDFLARLRDQAEFLLASARAFYTGNYAEGVRIATALRVLVYETSQSKSLLRSIQPNGLDLSILNDVADVPPGEEVFNFAVSIRIEGLTVFPTVDFTSAHYSLCSIGAWWDRRVFSFWSTGEERLSVPVVFTRKEIIRILANKEGGAHVDPTVDSYYARLLTDQPLQLEVQGVPVATPDLARFLAAQSGVEMLDCLKRHFFPDLDVAQKWNVGTLPSAWIALDQISGRIATMIPTSFGDRRRRVFR
jgi:hypothetical protein